MASSIAPNIVTDGLVLYLDAANTKSYPGSGTTWTDIVARNNGTLVNGPTFNSANGGSIVFDGVDDYVDCGDNSITKPSGSFTLSYWFKGISSFASNASGVGTTGLSGTRGYLLGPNTGTSVFFFIPSSSTTLISTSYSLTIDTQKWYNIVGVYSASNYIKIFLDGTEVSSNSTTIPSSLYTNNGISLKLGQRGDAYAYFSGNISQCSLYHKPLSATEVLQNYNATKTRFGL